ncbi:hypothetical protein EKO23_01295 [Nocardioides guangzhouensis]|uniref:Lipoprotein n=1 Tax=Nocardioides guangzhouensis TaxID=2497878 RepID=A0A4V1Y057_9ACTN|nr:hypothetical protein [Nocardioides guangzhouensis]RYP89089.1 hypothetical protein EKO23_01295 [Nocardioides guangzhouensis]
MRPSTMRAHLLPALVVALLSLPALTACAGRDPGPGPDASIEAAGGRIDLTPPAEPYAGPLYAEPHTGTRIDRAGAAGPVVECDTLGTDLGFNRHGFDDREAGATPESALLGWIDDLTWSWPTAGWRLERRDGDRVLFTFPVDGVVKQAVVVHDGETVSGGGWYVESWAQCDLSELPRTVTDRAGVLVWTDADGRPVPTTRVVSWPGPEHCDWQDSTVLGMGAARYWRKPPDYLASRLDGRYVASAPLPADARETGFRRGRDHLWLAADGRAAYVGTRRGVEVWPREARPIGCD